MKKQTVGAALLLALLSSTSSWAAATPEEAQRIAAVFQSYLGTTAGVVTVTPDGDGYDIALDPGPYFALIKQKQPELQFSADPIEFTITPQGDGTWEVEGEGPYKAAMVGADQNNLTFDVKDYSWSGTYSEKLYSFTESEYTVTGMNMVQHTVDPSTKMVTDQTTQIEIMTGKSTTTGATADAVDSEGVNTATNLTGTTKVTLPPELAAAGMPEFSYKMNVGTINYNSSIKGFAARQVMDLVAFFVARPGKDLIVKDQALLKEKLLAALPLFASMAYVSKYGNTTINTTYGDFTLTDGTVDLSMNGAVKDGNFAENFSVKGFSLPASLPLPPWSKGLVPKDFNLGFAMSGFDLDTSARKFIAEMDVSKDTPVPPGSEMAYLESLLPTQNVIVTIPPSNIVADLFTLSYEGTGKFNVATTRPGLALKVRMTGMDKVTAQLTQASADPMVQQGLAALFAAKGMAKADGDALVWDINMGDDGKLMINGQDLSGMIGGPPPQQ